MCLKEWTRGNWPTTADSISGMTPTYTNSAQMDSYIAAFQLVKHRKSSIDVTHPLMEDTMGLIGLMQKFGRVDFCGQLCMKTPKILFGDAMHVKGMGTSI